MLSGSLSYIEGARKLTRSRFAADLENDSDLIPFVVIDSEADAFPFGPVREHWHPEALVKLQPEIERSEAWAGQLGRLAAERLATRFSK